MSMENRRLIFVVCAALVLCLLLALSPLIWLFVARPQFEAHEARVRIVFRVNLDESADNRDAVLESVRQTIERRLTYSDVVPEFLVQIAGENQIEVLTPEIEDRQIEEIREFATRPGSLEFSLLANRVDHATEIAAATSSKSGLEDDTLAWMRVAEGNDIGFDDRYAVFRDSADGVREFLVVRGPLRTRITGDYLVRASPGTGPNGSRALEFQFNQRGDFLTRQLTTTAAPRPGTGFKHRLAIILDGEIHSAPTINEPIGGRGQIIGEFTDSELYDLAVILNVGALPAPVEFLETEDLGEGVE